MLVASDSLTDKDWQAADMVKGDLFVRTISLDPETIITRSNTAYYR